MVADSTSHSNDAPPIAGDGQHLAVGREGYTVERGPLGLVDSGLQLTARNVPQPDTSVRAGRGQRRPSGLNRTLTSVAVVIR